MKATVKKTKEECVREREKVPLLYQFHKARPFVNLYMFFKSSAKLIYRYL